MHIIQHSTRDADGEDGQLSLGLVLHAARDVDDYAFVQLDLLILAPCRATPARSVPCPGGPEIT